MMLNWVILYLCPGPVCGLWPELWRQWNWQSNSFGTWEFNLLTLQVSSLFYFLFAWFIWFISVARCSLQSPDKILCWPQQQQVSGWTHLRSDTGTGPASHPVTQSMGLTQCQITPAISGSNEEDYLLINAPVIFVGNGRGKKRGWTNGKTVLDNYDMTLFQNMVEASKYFLWDLGAPPENVQSFFCIQKG